MKPDCIGILTPDGRWLTSSASDGESSSAWSNSAGILTTLLADYLTPGDLLSLRGGEDSWWVWSAFTEGVVCATVNHADPNIQRASLKFEALRCGWLDAQADRTSVPPRRSPPRTEPRPIPYQSMHTTEDIEFAAPSSSIPTGNADEAGRSGTSAPQPSTAAPENRSERSSGLSGPKAIPLVTIPVQHNWSLPSWNAATSTAADPATPSETAAAMPQRPATWNRAQMGEWFGEQILQASQRLGVHLVTNHFKKAIVHQQGPAWLTIDIRGDVLATEPEAAVLDAERASLELVYDTWRRQCTRFDPSLSAALPRSLESSMQIPARQTEQS